MSLLHNIQLVDLEVYNDRVKHFLDGTTAFGLFLDNGFVKREFGLSH